MEEVQVFIDDDNFNRARQLFKNGVVIESDVDWLDFYGILCLFWYIGYSKEDIKVVDIPKNVRDLNSELPHEFEVAGIQWVVL